MYALLQLILHEKILPIYGLPQLLVCVCVCVCPQLFSHVRLFVMPWTVASLESSVCGIFQANILEQAAISL